MMTKVNHKTPDARRTRRNRYIAAIEPFRKQFGCTAAEVYENVQALIRRAEGVLTRKQELEDENSLLKRKVSVDKAQYENKIAQLELECATLKLPKQ
jgi:hypothetical protein